jgi:hypothetical protein
MPNLQVGMVQCLFTADSLCWVETEHLGEEVDGKGVGVRIERGERDPGLDRERPDIILGLSDGNETRIENKKQKKWLTRGEPTRRRVSSEGVPK